MSRGYCVRTLTRSDWATVPAVPIDQRYLGALPHQIPVDALRGVHVVVHCAGQVEGGDRAAHAVNVEGTIRLAQLARQAGAQSFIFLSSQSARPDAISSYGQSKYAAEQKLREVEGLPVIVVRPGLVTGPGSRGLFQRMSRAVQSLPILPLLGGGRSIVQPIHVDDLCAAVFRCDEMTADLQGRILLLGDPRGVALAEFLQVIAVARFGRRKVTLPIPLWPVEVALRAAEALRIPLPINRNNLKGLKIVERMVTAADLARLDLSLRPLPDMVREVATPADQNLPLKERAVRVLLIGAGRVGLVHAVTLSRLSGVVLSGIVDPKAGATALLRGMGLSAPAFRSLEEALRQVRPDAAIIATPPSTHLPLARACLARGLAVMVEKPLALQAPQLAEYQALAEEFPAQPIQVGYVMRRNPQITTSLERLRAGAFGNVRGFLGLTLLSLIQKAGMQRWEVHKRVSGGGAWINAGGHVLSMIHAAFGEPQDVEAQTLKCHSTEVEDSVVVNFRYPEFRGAQYCSWSIDGYPRQENMLTIWTEQGRLVLTASVGAFIRNDGAVELTHQLDFDAGFNLAPDYAGGGFTAELHDLEDATRTGRSAPMDLREAARLERLLFRVYDVAREVRTFPPGSGIGEPLPAKGLRLSGGPVAPTRNGASGVRRVLDLRDLPPGGVQATLKEAAGRPAWDEFLLGPAHMQALGRHGLGDRLRVTVPDFLTQSRLLSIGRHREVLTQMGVGGILAAARAATSVLASERAPTFWVAAMGLLAAALAVVPPHFQGTLLLHSYLTDLALGLRRLDALEKLLRGCRRRCPSARIGIHTNMALEALNAISLLETPVDEVSVLTSPNAPGMPDVFRAMRLGPEQLSRRLTAEVGLAPSVVHRLAFDAPLAWAHGADAVLIGIAADPQLAQQWRAGARRAWADVFPGLDLPEGAL